MVQEPNLYIDGYVFEKCRFDNCSLVTSVATFAFRECFISPDCRILFDSLALKIARLLMYDLLGKGRIVFQQGEAGVYPKVHGDGTFTLE